MCLRIFLHRNTRVNPQLPEAVRHLIPTSKPWVDIQVVLLGMWGGDYSWRHQHFTIVISLEVWDRLGLSECHHSLSTEIVSHSSSDIQVTSRGKGVYNTLILSYKFLYWNAIRVSGAVSLIEGTDGGKGSLLSLRHLFNQHLTKFNVGNLICALY